jgi:hypothetical protein
LKRLFTELIFFADNDRKKTINNHQVAPAGGECRLISCGWPSGRAEKESRTHHYSRQPNK